ncbi:MAG: Hsp20/alpha crystallin family protein [Candidatus Cloacimonetes bacterium]|nr:Hsp20/alpha crystallin family protein [Candidatus Cloacimonadota bacterium]
MSLVKLFRDLEPGFNTNFSFIDPAYRARYADEDGVKSLHIAIDVIENDAEYILEAEVPGIELEDIKIKYEDDYLILSGEKLGETSEENKVLQSKRHFGKFVRKFTVPEGVDLEQIKATMKHGVLKVSLPKVEIEEKKSREIEISLDS